MNAHLNNNINIVSPGAEFAETENMQIAAKCEWYKDYIVFFAFE